MLLTRRVRRRGWALLAGAVAAVGSALLLSLPGVPAAATPAAGQDYLTAELRARVERLKIEAATPTDDHEILLERTGRRARFTYTDLEKPKAGDSYYVRVRQVDGSMAWSSPWWIEQE
jgi:hypothetical protein